MIKYCSAILCLIVALCATTSMAQVDYSNHVTYYHYPAPPKSLQFHAPLPQTQRSVNGAAQAYQNQYQANNAEYAPYNSYQTTSAITRQFISPALDNVAFNLALTNQGYSFGNTPAVNAALTATSRSSKTSAHSASPLSATSSSSSPQIASLNIKLPLPIGLSPLNIAPLPLQAGAPYTAIPNAITSYGTLYPQRKRR